MHPLINRRSVLLGGAAVLGAVSARAARAQPRGEAMISDNVYVAIYRPGPQWRPGKPTNAQPLRAHGAYLLELHAAGRLLYAGPFGDDSGGAAVFTADTDELAQEIARKDPAIIDGVMTCTVHRWRLVDWDAAAARTKGP